MKGAAHGFMTAQPITTCPDCGKQSYTDRAQAKRAARSIGNARGKLRAYRCGRYWHLTSQAAGTVERYRDRKTGQGNG